MPRLAGLDVPGVLHHIMIRGIERRKIFRDNKDRDDFIERLSIILPESKENRGRTYDNKLSEEFEHGKQYTCQENHA